ncbi:MAG: pyrroline-5-carboxylate reductase [Betaproteobacteria bacterium]
MKIAFIGGGNMATALIGGLLGQQLALPADVQVVEIDGARCGELQRRFGVQTATAPGAALAAAEVVVLAVKPQQMGEVCAALRPHLAQPLVLSVAAGIRATDLACWLGTERIVRAMPNTPALVGKGVSGLVALPPVTAAERALAERILHAVGQVVWLEQERQLDAVTALSGSGPAYVFYFIEALLEAGRELGLTAEQTRTLAIETFVGAAALAAASPEPVATLRAQVTSKGGTTAAALARLEKDEVKQSIVAAIHAACERAQELGDEFGRSK